MSSKRIPVGDRVTIFPRGKKGIYCACFSQNGQHLRRSLNTTNQKIAIERATRLAAQLIEGTFLTQSAPAEIDIPDAVNDYLRTLEVDGRAQKTLTKYRGILNNVAAFLGEQHVVRMRQITARFFDLFRQRRRKDRHPKTVYTESVVVKQFLKWARTRKLIDEDPLAGIKLNKPRREQKRVPTIDEVRTILAAADEPLRTWLAVLAYTGMRVGELQRLQVSDVDLKAGWIRIESRKGLETKTRTSRKIPIHEILRPVLEAVRGTNRNWFFTAGASHKYPDGGHWISAKKVNDRLAAVLSRVGLTAGRQGGFVTHSLRHFFETFTVNSGIPQRVIDVWMGHSSDQSMGVNYYGLNDTDSQRFMRNVPFETSVPAASAGKE